MKKLITIVLSFFSLVSFAQVSRDFQSQITFSAPGDGTTDVTLQWNAAVNYCYSRNKKLFIPAGTYNLAGASDLAGLYSGAGSINWEGEGDGSILLVPGKAARVLDVSNCDITKVSIKNIHFKSTHDTTNAGNNCLLFQGINGHLIHNVNVYGCTFEGFTASVTGRGIVDLDISGCYFLAPAGHDNATTTTSPAVFIGAVDNNLADLNRNWRIHDNTLDGYSGTGAITATKTGGPMDNAFYGHVSGLQFYNNTTRNFAQEHVLLQPQLAVIDSARSNIYGNHINAYIPLGSAVNGVKVRSNYGIRADGQHVSIYNNDIMGATNAIWCDATPYNYQYRDLLIVNNTISYAKDTAMKASYGIYVRGYNSGLPMKGVRITGNSFNVDSVFLNNTLKNISATYVDSPNISGNSTTAVRMTKNGFGLQHIYIGTCNGVLLGDNPQIGADTVLFAQSSTYGQALPAGTTAVTQASTDQTALVATDLYVATAVSNAIGKQPNVVKSLDATGSTTTGVGMGSYTTVGNSILRVSGFTNVNSISTDVFSLRITYTDWASNSRTLDVPISGGSVSSISATGTYYYAPVTIMALGGTVPGIFWHFSNSSGSINYDFSLTLENVPR